MIEGLSVKLSSTSKNAPKNPLTQISTVMRTHMKQATDAKGKLAEKLGEKVAMQEVKNDLGHAI